MFDFPVFSELGLPREVNKEMPVEGHKDDCKVFYIFNYPMTCGEELVIFQPLTKHT